MSTGVGLTRRWTQRGVSISMGSNRKRLLVDAKSLTDYYTKMFTKENVPEDEAFMITDSLVVANPRGVDPHGVNRMPIYMQRLRENLVKSKCSFEVIREAPGSMMVDGQSSLGTVLGVKVMEKAIKKSKESGVIGVGVCNLNHYGTASYFSMMALMHDMIALSASNAPPTMAPWGGTKPFSFDIKVLAND